MSTIYAGPLIIAFGVAFFCIVALAGTTGNVSARAFRIGPFLLIPLVILWGVTSGAACSKGECHDLWRTLPLYGAMALAVRWHVALIVHEGPRRFYLAYAAIHLPLFYLFWTLAMVLATNFPL